MSTGDARSTYFTIDRSCTLTLPAPPPVPRCVVPVWLMPHDQDSASISSLWALSTDSPLMPSSFRNASIATCYLPFLLQKDASHARHDAPSAPYAWLGSFETRRSETVSPSSW